LRIRFRKLTVQKNEILISLQDYFIIIINCLILGFMKKIYFILFFTGIAGLLALQAQNTITTPVDGVKYHVMQVATQKFMSVGDISNITTTNVIVAPFEGGATNDDQCFNFVSITGEPDNYYIKNVKTGAFLFWSSSENAWTMRWSTDTSVLNGDNAKFTIEVIDYRVFIANVGRVDANSTGTATTNYLGTDNMTATTIYCNKDINNSAQEPYTEWEILAQMSTYNGQLAALITHAQDILDETAGNDQFTPEMRQTLTDALDAANAVMNDTNSTQAEIDTAVGSLQASLDIYTAFTPVKDAIYNISSDANGMQIGMNPANNRVAIQTPSNDDNQKLSIVPVDGKPNIYRFQAPSGQLMAVTSANANVYDMYFSNYEDVAASNRDNRVEYAIRWFSGDLYEIVSQLDPGNIVGTDATDENSALYANKTESVAERGHWRFKNIGSSGIKQINTNDLVVFVSGKTVDVNNLTGNNVISIYAITGQLIFVANTTGDQFTTTLHTGNYIINVRGVNNFSKLIVVQ